MKDTGLLSGMEEGKKTERERERWRERNCPVLLDTCADLMHGLLYWLSVCPLAILTCPIVAKVTET